MVWIESIRDHFAVILELERVEAAQGLRIPENGLQGQSIDFNVPGITELLHMIFSHIHGVDEARGDTAREEGSGRVRVGSIGKEQTLHERSHGAGGCAEIDGGSQHQGIGPADARQDR